MASCAELPPSSLNQKVSEGTLLSASLLPSNHNLSKLSISDQAWVDENYEQIETDTFVYRTFFEKTLTLVANERQVLPITQPLDRQFKVVYFGEKPIYFENRLAYYAAFQSFSSEEFNWKSVKEEDVIFLVIHQTVLTNKEQSILDKINLYANQIVVLNFENIKNLVYFQSFPTVIQNYEDNLVTQDWSAQLIFGGIQAKGKLPVTISDKFKKGTANAETPIIRLKYTLPEDANMQTEALTKIDKIVNDAIQRKATPSAQIMVIKSNKVVYYQSFGHFEYNKTQKVENLNLYDLASVTKVAATTLAVMKLYEDGWINTEHPLKNYLAESSATPLKFIKLKHLLTHRSGLVQYAPVSQFVRIGDTTNTRYKAFFANKKQEDYTIKINPNMYMKAAVQEKIWQSIWKFHPSAKPKYLYSDINFMLLQKVSETVTNENLDGYVNRHFYQPLGLNYLCFNPLEKIEKTAIVPTSFDKKWRKKLLQGEVNDEVCALFGGVGGHAGLFSNANDVGVLFQMLLNKGNYGGEQVLNAQTIEHFIYDKTSGRRALGFDRKGHGCYKGASSATFGHSGFTGTCVWADPKEDLIYVFLSNRVYPDTNNRRLITLFTREAIHKQIYNSIQKNKNTSKVF